ncbi:hypothetical protein TPHA_0F01940 [Tetrapisispora phaffii CBS 4417]|uniref:Small ribosomal subunit protein uS4m n=1 Tax=Tetrapisispora phaffii (strain ATCC 24235 / CBS 4417 / NBRC 1672 / NRRL Y-8282 / UCD 70-5) TaxID=1071381 RepID=G8BV94_TETPH|nr:mitochondrial 37S ribosomal protein NAM9 TPHA_0F01940 [Tetrapisispora phaffii CBS 4417]CCE63676.1 hypothetical protein TPHA_0F01940 [Tetrapisispora phaffii CBS 4417]
MPKKGTLLKSLSRGRVRASFNKYNLFNLYKKSQISFRTKTLYQQKWQAKQETRSYHGEHIREGRWQIMFQSKLDSVAQLDASLRGGKVEDTPYLLQTYAVLEKRLDFALFRAMFASSIRQARQFILHGNVHVNGVRVKHPSFILKPGDVFNVKQEKVLQALGAKKPDLKKALNVDKRQIILHNKFVEFAKKNPKQAWKQRIEKIKQLSNDSVEKKEYLTLVENYKKGLDAKELEELRNCTPEELLKNIIKTQPKQAPGLENDKAEKSDASTEAEKPNESAGKVENLTDADFESIFERDVTLKNLATQCYQEFSNSKLFDFESIKAKSEEEISTLVKDLLSPSDNIKKNLTDSQKVSMRTGKKHLSELEKKYSEAIRKYYKIAKNDSKSNELPFDSNWINSLVAHEKLDFAKLADNEQLAQTSIKLPNQHHVWGRKRSSLPFFTPWKPRPFLAPFAILPHHLEISFLTCHAVYLRNPVARPGHSEVISPFDTPLHERAYMFYNRKGK